MKKIITAMGNEVLNFELRKYSAFDVLLDDIICQDSVISKITKIKADVLIISGLLQGRWSLEEFIEKIRKEDKTVRIIIVTDEIDGTTRSILNDYNVLDIFLDSSVEIQDIVDAIEREDTIKKKYEMMMEKQEEYQIGQEAKNIELNETTLEKVVVEKAVQKQEIIVMSGIPGSGKSTIAANLCKVLSQKSDSKILLIDLDTLNGNIEEIIQVNKVPTNIEILMDDDKRSGLNYATELMMKNRFDSNVFGELVVNANGFDVLTGNTSLHYCQNVLEEKYYDKILQCAREKYDFIVIDTSSNIFLDSTKWAVENATRVLFVTEADNISLRKMQQFMNIIVNTWGIFKKKIDIIVNKKSKKSIEQEVISRLTDGLRIVGEIKYEEEENEVSYERILATIHYIPKKNIFQRIGEMRKNLFSTSKLEKVVPVHVN